MGQGDIRRGNRKADRIDQLPTLQPGVSNSGRKCIARAVGVLHIASSLVRCFQALLIGVAVKDTSGSQRNKYTRYASLVKPGSDPG